MRHLTRLLAALALLSGATAALAQGFAPYNGLYPNPRYEGRSGFGAPPQYCQQLCAQDTVPCDPPEYKRADGRCTNPIGIGGGGFR